MLTLRELRNMVEVAEVEGRVPSVKALLEAKVPIIVKELLSEQAEISVYQNGFVLYRVGKRATVFPLHSCKEYIYDSNIEALTNINERFFDNENWYIRLILEGEDRLVKNQEVRNGKKTISYSAVAEDWNELREEDSTLAHSACLISGQEIPDTLGTQGHPSRNVSGMKTGKRSNLKRILLLYPGCRINDSR